MNRITITLPNNIKLNSFEIVMVLATRLFEEGKLSAGQAAEMAEISKRSFIELAGKYGVSVFGYDFEELQDDLKHV